jgi:hypothetical protein
MESYSTAEPTSREEDADGEELTLELDEDDKLAEELELSPHETIRVDIKIDQISNAFCFIRGPLFIIYFNFNINL